MRRRDVIFGLAALAAGPAAAQQQKSVSPKRIGVLWHAGNAEEEHEYLTMLVNAFADLGYVEGKNVQFLHRYPAETPERYPVLARELVENNVDLLIAVSQDGAHALKAATKTIPIVFVVVNDPLRLGLIESLAHPGGNLT